MKTGNTWKGELRTQYRLKPQWSPVMKTGNTVHRLGTGHELRPASMEPGHEDREYGGRAVPGGSQQPASMEPGHEDREYLCTACSCVNKFKRLNGARS